MNAKALACLWLAVLASSGCRGSFSVNAGSSAVAVAPATPGVSVSNSQISVTADSALGAAIVLGIIAADAIQRRSGGDAGAGTGGGGRGPAAFERAPAVDPSRRVNVQDCSKPVDYAAGNLQCR